MTWLKKLGYSFALGAMFVSLALAGEKINVKDGAAAGMTARSGFGEKVVPTDKTSAIVKHPRRSDTMEIHGHYIVTAYDVQGRKKWSESFDNLVTTVGKNAMLDQYLAGSGWTTGTVYMMLKSSGSAAAGDTMASHAGWTELNISASSGVRQSVTFAAASSGSKATSSAVNWSITAAGPTTVAGVAIVVGGTSTNGNTTGTLFSAGDFSSSRSVISGDTLAVTYSVGM